MHYFGFNSVEVIEVMFVLNTYLLNAYIKEKYPL